MSRPRHGCLLAVALMWAAIAGCSRAPSTQARDAAQILNVPTDALRESNAKPPRDIVRALYAVVDRDGIYFGDHRTDFTTANAVLDALAKRNDVQWVFCRFTESARFGDAVRFYSAVDPKKYYVFPLPTIADPPGHRVTLIRAFRDAGADHEGWWVECDANTATSF